MEKLHFDNFQDMYAYMTGNAKVEELPEYKPPKKKKKKEAKDVPETD